MTEDDIGRQVVDAAGPIRQAMGSGLLETVYEVVLAHELRGRGLLVENKVIIELKCVERLNNAHKQQRLTCLRLTGRKPGYLLNFGEALMTHGITRSSTGSLKQVKGCLGVLGVLAREDLFFRPQILLRSHN